VHDIHSIQLHLQPHMPFISLASSCALACCEDRAPETPPFQAAFLWGDPQKHRLPSLKIVGVLEWAKEGVRRPWNNSARQETFLASSFATIILECDMTASHKRPYTQIDTMSSSGTHGTKRIATGSATTETNSESSRSIFSDTVSHSTNQTDVESDSELSTSSEEPSSSSEEEEDSDDESDTTDRASTRNDSDITNVRPGTKPEMKLNQPGGGLLQRLKTFLPALEAANQELEKEKKDGTIERRNIERVEEGEGTYIELVSGYSLHANINNRLLCLGPRFRRSRRKKRRHYHRQTTFRI
jgi:hypothetical protein